MFDAWIAECLPCKWETRHRKQDDAIHAAEDHVFSNHRDVNSAIRGAEKMGHVQNRTIDGTDDSTRTAPAPQLTGNEQESAASTPAAEVAPGNSDITSTPADGGNAGNT